MSNAMPEVTNLEQVAALYRSAGDGRIALFLGAGVNGGAWARGHPACASWPELLKALDRRFHPEPRLQTGFAADDADWISVAARLLEGKDRGAVIRAIDEAVYAGVFRHPERRGHGARKHKILAWTVLRGMDTLRAAVSFSAAIGDPARARSMRRNPKVGRVLTTNYDFFFSAAWPRYTSMRQSWWPLTWASTGTRPASAAPIVYLHGYLPYSGGRERDVILTRDDYNRAYAGAPGSGRAFAWQELTDAAQHCHLLFIGFSFSDMRVAEALRRSSGVRRHFAFLIRHDSRSLAAARQAGVTPVVLASWEQLPGTLGQLYRAGLTQRELERTAMTGPQYWSRLLTGLEPRSQTRRLDEYDA